MHLRAGSGGGDNERWFQIQDLIVEEIRKEMIFLGETMLQVCCLCKIERLGQVVNGRFTDLGAQIHIAGRIVLLLSMYTFIFRWCPSVTRFTELHLVIVSTEVLAAVYLYTTV